ncbi:MAG: hypothetical protein ACFHHU_03520 [Porticoccaceae bacterium]
MTSKLIILTAADEVHHPSVVLEWTAADVDFGSILMGVCLESCLRIEQLSRATTVDDYYVQPPVGTW